GVRGAGRAPRAALATHGLAAPAVRRLGRAGRADGLDLPAHPARAGIARAGGTGRLRHVVPGALPGPAPVSRRAHARDAGRARARRRGPQRRGVRLGVAEAAPPSRITRAARWSVAPVPERSP